MKKIIKISFDNDIIIFEFESGEVVKKLLHPKIKTALSKMFGIIISTDYDGKGV